MPRSARDSDEDVEIKIGRRTRAVAGPIVPDSPIRRSSRNKQSTKQNDSSPDLSIVETSNTQSSRSFRTRAGTIDSNSLEIQRRLRSNKNIVEMSETKDSEASTEMQPKKITRRSIAAINASETPKANTRVRRLTRAGSETKTTPTGRVTRKTRASSMDPESTAENQIKEKYDSHVIDTPSRAKRRASVLPSESTVIEEEEKQIPLIDLEKTLMEEDESASNVSPKNVEPSDEVSLKNESNEEHKNTDKETEEMDCSAEGPVDHSSQNDHMEIGENVKLEEPLNKERTLISDANKVLRKDKDDSNKMEVTLSAGVVSNISVDSLHSVETISEKIELKNKSMLNNSLEEGEINTSNKENECLNTSNSISKQSKNESVLNVSLEKGEISTSNKENEYLNLDNSISEQPKNINNIKKLSLEASSNVLDTSEKGDKKDQCNDNTKLGNSCLMECSVAVLNCDSLIQTFKAYNETQNYNLCKENNVSIVDTKAVKCSEKDDNSDAGTLNDKSNECNVTVMENSDLLDNTASHKILNEENKPKQQSCSSNDYNNTTPIESTTIEDKEDNLITANQSMNNANERNCEIDPEVNISEISNKTLNTSVNPKENLIDTSIKEDKCTGNTEITEITNVNNDINESTTLKDSYIKEDDIPSTNENQNNESIGPKDSDIKQDDALSTNEIQDNMSISTHNSPTISLQVSDTSNEEPANNTEQVELHSSECLIDLQSSKPSNSILETNDSSTVAEFHGGPEEALRDEEGSKIRSSLETANVSKRKSLTGLNLSQIEKEAQKDDVQNDESDNISSLGMLFQDISADEWKQKRQNLNTEGENNSIHSSSTVKLENDSETECDLVLVDKEAWLAAENLKTIKDKETFDYDSDDTIVLKSKLDYLNDKINNSNEMKKSSKDSMHENDNADSLKSLSKKIQETFHKKATVNECDTNESLQNTSKIEKSLNKSKEDTSHSSKGDLVKSSDNQLEEEVESTESQKESEDHNKSENKLASPILERKETKNHSLKNSSNKKNKLKEGFKKYNRLHIPSSDEEDETNNSGDNKDKVKGNEAKRNSRNYSTMVHIGSDSETSDNNSDSSKNTKNKSPRIPCFLFKNKNSAGESEESDDEMNEDRSSKGSVDSDINREYNLDGKTIGKFSDDDIPGDECRASESESSDPDDNGSDLADFVVDDDEVEEEEEDEDEDEDGNEEEEEEEEKEEEEDTELDEEMKDEEVTEEKNEKKGNDLSSEENEKDTSNKYLNVSTIKSDKKKNRKERTSLEAHSVESLKDEIVADVKDNTSVKLDSTLSEKKKKKKQKLNENSETIEETPKSHFNESDVTLTKKAKVANASLTCSTPKTDFHEYERFKHNVSSEKKKRRYIEKTSINEESEKVCSRNLSADNSDHYSKTASTNSVNEKKRHSMENNISAESLELVKGINLPKSLLSKKAHLNKTMSPTNETPTTKYLKKQKLNDSAPLIKLEETKTTSANISLSDKTTSIIKQDETTLVIGEKTVDMLELDPSLSDKREKSIKDPTDLNYQTKLRHKKLIFETGQISEIDDKAELQTTSDNEKENSKCRLKVNDGKKKRKKNKGFQELDIVDAKAKIVEDINNDDKIEVISNIQSKKNKKKNKNKQNVENENKRNDKPSNDVKTSRKCTEAENIPNKKKKKVMSEIPSSHTKEHSKQSLGWNVSESLTSPNVEFSNNARIEFLKSKQEALQAAKRAAESIKANKHVKKKIHGEHSDKMQQKTETVKPIAESTMLGTYKRGIKRLSVDFTESFSDVSIRPRKKQKLSQKSAELPSFTVIKNGFIESGITKVNKNAIPSNSGGTTEFDVINLKKAKKPLNKKISAVATFRQKMLSRNSRYPVSSYIMYLQKQKALGGDHGFVKQF